MLDATNTNTTSDTVMGVSKEEYRRVSAWLDGRIKASEKAPSAEVITITPVLSQLLLGRNNENRPFSNRNSQDLASDIANKRWEFNGESIVVSKKGNLLDGQHRCQQVMVTGCPIESVIVFGPRDEARFTIDTGKSKTVSNFLAMKGKVYTHALGPAVNYVLQYREYGYLITAGTRSKQVMPTKSQIVQAADELHGIERSIEFTAGSMKTVKSHSVLAFCHFIFSKRAGPTAADEFMLKVIEGDGLKKGSPVLYCRNRLMGLGRGPHANVRAELIFKCWNAHRRGYGVENGFRMVGGKLPKVEK